MIAASYCAPLKQLTVVSLLLVFALAGYAQSNEQPFKLNTVFFEKLNKKLININSSLQKNTDALLKKMQQKEEKLKKQLFKKDSLAAKQIFKNQEQFYASIKKNSQIKSFNTEYIPKLDSLSTALDLIAQPQQQLKLPTGIKVEEISAISKNINGLQNAFQSSTQIKKLLNERKKQLAAFLKPYGLSNYTKQIHKEVFYYQAKVNEWKRIISDEAELQNKLIGYARNLPAFKDFFAKKSWLSNLFPNSTQNTDASKILTGLQNREEILAAAGRNLSASSDGYRQQIEQADNEINKLKSTGAISGGDQIEEMPDFKPNSQKTKSFLKRMELDMNVQSKKVNGFFPTTTDLAFNVGYKLNDKSIVGIGLAYKVGLGRSIQHIQISHQGLGLRSFLDIKLKKNFWISGGYEQNYLPEIDKHIEAKEFSPWQQSGLIGIKKKFQLGKRTNNIQVLWDFLSYSQPIKTEPIQVRFGFKL
jgi:hypothetical protein